MTDSQELERQEAWRKMEERKKNLKIQALQEKVAELEDKNADLRVEITITTEEYNKHIGELDDKLTKYEDRVIMCENNHGGPPAEDGPQVIDGEVV